MSEQKKKKFNWFNSYAKDGKGVTKEETERLKKPTFANFFKIYFGKLGQLLSVNMFIIFGNFPVFFALFGVAGYLSMHSTAPYYQVYSALRGALQLSAPSPINAALIGIFGMQAEITVASTGTYIMYALGALAIFTFGLVNVGTTHIIRSMVRAEPVFMWSDFWYAIKRNLRQGLIFGIIDLFLMGMLVYDIYYFLINSANMMMNIFFWVSILMAVVYMMMRFYIYIMMITFDLSLFKLIKNSLIFSILGIKRNILAVLGIAAIVILDYMLFVVFVPIGVILPFIILFATGSFMGAYASYPIIKKYMIDPYYPDEESSDDEDSEVKYDTNLKPLM